MSTNSITLSGNGLILSNFKESQGSSVLYRFDVEIENSGWKFNECRLMQGTKGRFVSFPSREYQKQDGTKGYKKLIENTNEDILIRFNQAILTLIDEHFNNNKFEEKLFN